MYRLGYALWLVPSEPECGALQRLMNFRPQPLSSTTHSSRSYPRFDPHITLATFSSPPVLPLAELLPRVKATPVHFESIKVGSSYLGSLSVVVSKDCELMNLRDYTVGHLKKVHKMDARSHSFPHMSLFYLDETLPRERHRLADILRSSGRVIEQRGGRGVALNCTLDGAAPGFHAMSGFMGSEIWLVECFGAVEDWKVLERRKLVQPDRYFPMSAPVFYGHNPMVARVPGHTGLGPGHATPAPYIPRGEPFFYRPDPVIPVIPYHPNNPR